MKTLFRPIGEKELTLIIDSNFKRFPPRLDWQPIFYPVLNEKYASEISEKWNSNDEFGNYLGFVTKFSITENEFNKYKVENVGGMHHNELWIPSEKLNVFNDSIVGEIEIVKVFIGKNFKQSNDERVSKIIDDLNTNKEKEK